jgi:replicative DNA helicase
MSAGQLVQRILSAESEIMLEKISRGKLEDHEVQQLYKKGIERLAKAPIYIDDSAALNIFELRAKARRLVNKHNVGLILIDYLQLMSGAGGNKNTNREQEISNISRNLKGLAKELGIPIIALSQLSREVEKRKEGNKMPQLSDLRESGAIEQDADMVMFLYRPEYYGINNDEMGNSIEGETHIHVAKHRNGSTDTLKVRFIKEFQKFVDIPEENFGGNFAGGFTQFNPGANPQAGIRRDPSEFGGSKLFVPSSGFQTLPSKANDVNWEDDDPNSPPFKKNNKPNNNEDIPF